MTLVWSPETASKAYLDTIQTCEISSKTSAAEFLAAMAGGYNAKLIVETWKKDANGEANITTSIGLAIAANHTHGRHVCVVRDEASRVEYVSAMQKLSRDVSLPEVMVGEVEKIIRSKLSRVDFLVVDGWTKDFTRAFNSVKLNQHGAILVCKNESKGNNISSTKFSWKGVLDAKVCVIIRAVTVPVGNGLEIAYIASNDGNLKYSTKNPNRWISHVDRGSGEEHVFRR
ncbi:PREDICTED: uncharacterized protein LOC109241631 [Nicotiana attenuata]|uniref:Uncharacterized protein n=1 Tax=Nicotiana attenuata TaxID=49451 RepID=A0A314L6X0_NICAT|nr:PREDICTED: uncharacterized protein LOC109241631 [Nicotiana attenuata]OIT36789.1 hypothetical protein A4A49_08381 [Nicotiana attenuata]